MILSRFSSSHRIRSNEVMVTADEAVPIAVVKVESLRITEVSNNGMEEIVSVFKEETKEEVGEGPMGRRI